MALQNVSKALKHKTSKNAVKTAAKHTQNYYEFLTKH